MDVGVVWEYLPVLLRGGLVTVQIALAGQGLALAVGVVVALCRVARARPVRAIATAYVHVTRGIPPLVQIYFAYFGLPALGVDLPPKAAAVLALGTSSSGYVAEAIRAGIQALPRGQAESGLALGLSYLQTARRIVLPQVFGFLLPTLTNEFVVLLKASSLTSIITVSELTWAGQIAAGESFAAVEIYLAIATLYLCMNLVLIYGAQRLEHRQKGFA